MRRITVLSALVTLGAVSFAGDWPQWQGPNRDAKCMETGLLKKWPEAGPRLLWTTEENLGKGFSTVSIADGSIYTTGLHGKDGWLYALDLEGTLRWKQKYGVEYQKFGKGARTTPTVDGDRVYIMSGMGLAACYEAKTGKRIWAVDTFKKFGGRQITWGIAESPLVVDDKVVLTPGGPDAVMVALNKLTGETIWQTRGLDNKSAYVSPLRIKEGRKDLIVTMTDNHIIGVRSKDGRLLWKHPYRGQCQAHVNTPVYHDGQVYITSGYNAGGVMMKLSDDGEQCEVLWKDDNLDVHHGGVVLVDGHIYGANWHSNRIGNWICLDWKTGEVKYDTRWQCKGSILYAEGMLYCYEEKGGTVGLVECTPKGFKVVSTFKVTQGEGQHWAHPVIAHGRLYIRHGSKLMCYDVKAN